jgi:hypothetical protein
MAVLGDTLYFAVDDAPADGAGNEGGLYSCDLTQPAPCAPKLIAAASNPAALSITPEGKVYYTDGDPGNVMEYVPPSGTPTVFRAGRGYVPKLYVTGAQAFFGVTIFQNGAADQHAIFFEALADGGVSEVGRYTKKDVASNGLITGAGDALYYSAYDYEGSTGGKVSRVSRPGSPGVPPCDFGAASNKRPRGLYLDSANLYWTNQGDPVDPYGNGSIAYCPLNGCCDTPTTLWTGDGEPVAIIGDATNLYWVTYDTGKVWKMGKP